MMLRGNGFLKSSSFGKRLAGCCCELCKQGRGEGELASPEESGEIGYCPLPLHADRGSKVLITQFFLELPFWLLLLPALSLYCFAVE